MIKKHLPIDWDLEFRLDSEVDLQAEALGTIAKENTMKIQGKTVNLE